MARITKLANGSALTNGKTFIKANNPKLGQASSVTIVVVPDYEATFDVQVVIGGVTVGTETVEATNNEPAVVDVDFAERTIPDFEKIEIKCANRQLGRKIRQMIMYCEVN